MPRVHRVPFSTNVHRVALAFALKGVDVEWVDHDADDRSALRELSGQELVPVLETDDGEVIVDSPVILRWIEATYREPPLWPADPARRARVDVLVEWFNGVWKGPPNALAEGRSADPGADAAQTERWNDLFEGLLTDDGDFLVGDEITAADVTIFPFLEVVAHPDPDDSDPFHALLREHVRIGPNVERWCRRMRGTGNL